MESGNISSLLKNIMNGICQAIAAFYKKRAVPFLCVILGILIVILVYALVSGAGVDNTDDRTMMERVRSKDVIECNISSINNFFYAYYSALASGEETVLNDSYDNPKEANIPTDLSTIVDKISNIKVYVTPGINQNEVAAFVSYDIYFDNISASAPSVDSYYLYVDSDAGTIKIMTDMYKDEDINSMLTLISYRNPIRTLLADTEADLYDILNENPDLRNLYVVMSSMTSNVDK